MIKKIPLLLCLFLATLFTHANPLFYKADQSNAIGKHIVLLGNDHEYRSEETIPALARILTVHHGFDCTVLFGLDRRETIGMGVNNVPGLEALEKADGFVIAARFLDLPDAQMKHIDAYLKRGGPVVGLRTSSHAFKIDNAKATYAKYHWQYNGADYTGGFGHQVLGQSWVGHYGDNHTQSTRMDIIPAMKDHPILKGVENIWVQSGAYNAVPQDDWDSLTMAQPLNGMKPDSPNDPNKEPKVGHWTRQYKAANGEMARAVTSLYGASEDLLNEGYRRMLVNSVYWALSLEDKIPAKSVVDFVGTYRPTTFGFENGGVRGAKPSDYTDLKSQIPADPKLRKRKAVAIDVSREAPARFVRVSLPGKFRILTLAEVEVISGGENVALSGTATQSSLASGGKPQRAIDGNNNGVYGSNTLTHTLDTLSNPWWEVDLGADYAIERIQIWNRAEGFQDRLAGFKLEVLDAKRQPVFVSSNNWAPEEGIQFNITKGGKIVLIDRKGNTTEAPPTIAADYRDPSPFAFQKEDTVAIIGNGLADRMQHDGWLETLIQAQLPEHKINFRNMSNTGDRAVSFPRSAGFIPLEQYLQLTKADVIFCMFGYNESFGGIDQADQYEAELGALVKKLRQAQPNGEILPRIVLFSPIAHENLKNPNLPNGKENNERLAAYTEATRKAAEANGVAFVDLFTTTQARYKASEPALTINGIHLNTEGNRQVAEIIASNLLDKKIVASDKNEKLRQAVLDKNWYWHNRYRATDGNDVWGGRSTLSFVDGQTNRTVLMHELTMLDVMTANRDPNIWAVAQGKSFTVDDANVPPPIPVISNVGGGSESSHAQKEGSTTYLSSDESLKKQTISDTMELNLFADETRFPELVNPVQLQVDAKGRLWAAAWTTYPKWEPLKKMDDRLLIFPDDDHDGVADRCITFAKVHNPLGFEFWNGGVIVTSQPDILFLKDTDGDDIADLRIVLVQGIGSSDTHHSANNLIYGPDGAIYWQSGIFLANNFETPWGPSLKTGTAAMYRFDPRTYTITQHAPNSPNPHGISFDRWGYHYSTDATGGKAYQVVPTEDGFKMQTLLDKTVRPVPASEVLSSTHFPPEMDNTFLICNSIGFLGLKHYSLERNPETGSVWGTELPDLVVSDDRNFRPTDAIVGEDGALYISDWQNVIIGHMQHNIRDPHRDHKHGRIFRLTCKDRPLQKPVKIAGAGISQLLENLRHPTNGVRQRSLVELSKHKSQAVIAAVSEWTKQFDPTKKEDAHPLLEALWVHQQHNVPNQELLAALLKSPEPHARNAAKTVNHYWNVIKLTKGLTGVSEEHAAEPARKSGVVSDTAKLTKINIGTLVEKLQYDLKTFTVKAGKDLEVTFHNPDYLPHNLVFTNEGAADTIAADAIKLGADGFKKNWIPESNDIIASTPLIDHKDEVVLKFKAPSKPGTYTFVCTFPGHDKLMRGTMIVTK